MQRHPDLSCSGRPGVSKIDKLQVLKRTGFLTVQAFIIRLSFLEDTVSIGREWSERHSMPVGKTLKRERRKKYSAVKNGAVFIANG